MFRSVSNKISNNNTWWNMLAPWMMPLLSSHVIAVLCIDSQFLLAIKLLSDLITNTDAFSCADGKRLMVCTHHLVFCLNSFPAIGDFCRLLITFANSLDPDQAQQCRVWSGSKLFDTLMVFLKDFLKKLIQRKKNHRQKSIQNYPACKELKVDTWAAFEINFDFVIWKYKLQLKWNYWTSILIQNAAEKWISKFFFCRKYCLDR